MNTPCDIPIKTNFICAYICRLVDGRDEYLVLRRASPYMNNIFGQVAGKIEPAETAVDAVFREIREEAGLEPDSIYSLDIVEIFFDPHSNSIMMIPAFVAMVPADSVVRLSSEHSEYKWISYEEAAEYFPFPLQHSSIKIIHNEFIMKKPTSYLKIVNNIANLGAGDAN